jgi:hypothetical protein
MKTILRTFLLAVAILSLYPNEMKSQNFNWAKGFTSSANITGYGIASDASGNSYVTGYFEGRATFGTNQISSNGVSDIFIAKYDPSGNCLWVKQAGGTSDDYGKGICVDAGGNIYVTGAFYGTSTFGTIELTSFGEDGNPDIFTAKYDPNGNCIWARQAGGNNFDYGFGIAVDGGGNSLVTGYFSGTAMFGGIQLISNGLKDIFIAKYDTNGNCLWAKQSGGTEDDIAYGIATDEDGNSFITGGFRNSLSFGTIRLVSYGSDDIFIAKYDPNGNCLWAKQAGDTCGDIGYSIAVDGNGNSYITGEFQRDGLFGTHSITSIGDYDIFTAKYDPNGECIWVKNLGGETEDRGRHISVDAIGDCYVTGQINTNGNNDIFITEYDPYGRNLWFQESGDAANDGGSGISSQANGDCYVTGTFGGVVDFGTTALSGGGAFVTKISNHNLNITAPTGNETWVTGTAHTITWNSNDDGNIKIEMLQYFGGSWLTIADSIKTSTGSYTFIVPGNGYYGSSIRLTSLSYNNVSVCPNYFNTIGGQTDLRITSPNTSLTCLFNTNQNITWVLTGSIANVKLEYTTNNGISWKLITNSTPAATQSYIWNVPSISSTSCRIRITDASNPYVYDVSDELFSISSAIQRSITVVSPKGGDIWEAGSTQTIRWTSNDVADLNIYFSSNGGKDWNIINTNIPAVWGSYTWKNQGIASPNCRIKLEDASDTTLFAVSNQFTISTSTSTLILISPNGGEKWQSGSTQTIKWTCSSNITSINIYISVDGGTTWDPEGSAVPATTQSFTLVLPFITYTTCKVKISDTANPLVFDESDTLFSIGQYDPNAKYLNIISPAGGERWLTGSIYKIQWTSSNIATLNVYYAGPPNDAVWKIIRSNIPANEESCSWLIPDSLYANNNIKIADASDTTVYTKSKRFNISKIDTSYPTFNMTLTNDIRTDSVYECDIYMLSTENLNIELSALTLGFTINNSSLNGGTLTASWVPGSNELSNTAQIPTAFNTTTLSNGRRVIKIVGKAPPGPGKGSLISNISPGTRIGRLRLRNSTLFSDQSLNISWEFILYPTSISAYVNTNNYNITGAGNFTTDLSKYALPVELSSFVTKVQERNIVLNWETKTEINFNKFEIERCLVNSYNALLNWIQIGSVPASGNSNSPKKYFFSERGLQSGKYQYRLKMIDNDGAFKYSDINIIEIAIPKDFVLNQNYPNPFNPVTRIEYRVPLDSKVMLEVYDITGKKITELVNQDQPAGYYSVDFLSSSVKLSSGVYIYRILAVDKATGKNFSAVRKMILMK